ncbi:MAG TPA: cellulase family glycosylhydrolase [Chloroflexota bacterium]|nr:cellulase family glycosylhydrolase [Chloroflexota bacterium]
MRRIAQAGATLAAVPLLLGTVLGLRAQMPSPVRHAEHAFRVAVPQKHRSVRSTRPPVRSHPAPTGTPPATGTPLPASIVSQPPEGPAAGSARALRALHRDLWLHAQGTQLYTAWGTKVTLKAVNWYGFEYAPFVPAGLDRAPLDSILRTIHRLGFNALRIMYADATVRANPVVTTGLDANPRLRGMHALQIMGVLLKRAHRFRLRVILCNSRSEAGMGPEYSTGLWYTAQYPESVWEADWLELAHLFRHDSAFVGADLRNEPHLTSGHPTIQNYVNQGPLWGAYQGTYYYSRDWHYAAQTLGNRLLAVNPHLLIVVEGVQMYFNPYTGKFTGGLWGSNLVGVQFDPITLDRPGQLVYSVHEYGPQMYLAHWFNSSTTFASLMRHWTKHWGYLLTAPPWMQAPIFVGEFGTCNNYYSCTVSRNPLKQGFWFTAFVRYMRAHPQVGWAYWALNPMGPFKPNVPNYYALMTPDWRHYHRSLVTALQPLLREPSG